jgi:ParB family chromosome partitioning protein
MAAKKTGLGKGLDGLIRAQEPKKQKNESTKNSETENKLSKSKKLAGADSSKKFVQQVKITEVEPNREQPRKKFDEDALLELADSIKQHGIIFPILVQKRDNYYEIIAGERRWRAAKIAGLKEVPVIVEEYSEIKIAEISLIENIQRVNLNAIEEARAYKKLIEEFKLKQDEVAEYVSKSRTAITNAMRLLKLEDRVQQMIVDEMISMGHARALLAIDDGDKQYEIATLIFDEKLSVREVEKLIKGLKNPPKNEKPKVKTEVNAIYKDLEEKLQTVIGTKVNISAKDENKGKIEIEYYSSEELEKIYDMLLTINS